MGRRESSASKKPTQTLFRRREKGGLKKETKLSSSTMVTCRSRGRGGCLCRRATSRMRKKNRNPASKESSGLREKAKGGLPDGALVFFNKLG